MLSVQFAQRRAERSRDAQEAITSKTGWSPSTKEQWDAALSALEQSRGEERRKRVQLRHAARRWQETLDRIQRVMRLVKQLGLIHFDNDPVRQHLVARLRTDGRSRSTIYEQGLAAHAAWNEAEPGWTISEEVTLETFDALLQQAAARQSLHRTKTTAWQSANAMLMAQARALEARNVSWYKVATVRFAAGTVEGDLIRAQVPTSTRPRKSRAKGGAMAVVAAMAPMAA